MMTKRMIWLALLVLAIGFSAACVAPVTQIGSADIGIAGDASERLTGALVSRNYEALQAMMSDEFRLATWQAQGQMLAPADAIEEVRVLYLEPAYSITFSDLSDAAAAIGSDPLALWEPEIYADEALYIKGLGVSGAHEAVLLIGKDQTGIREWVGMLVAPGGFPAGANAAMPSVEITATVQVSATEPPAAQLDAVINISTLQTTDVYSGPGRDYDRLGLLSSGQIASVIGLSADGEWWRIGCPTNAGAECWVSTALSITQRTDQPLQPAIPAALPAELPTPAPTATQPAPTPVAAADATQPTTPSPTAIAPVRISFAPGSISASVRGNVALATPRQYLLRVLAGQTITIDLLSPANAANFAVTGVTDGQPYKRVVNEDRFLSFVAPITQDYSITVASVTPTEFTMNVIVPPLPEANPTATPERITFAAGAISATRTGSIQPGQTKEYVIRVLAGQQMTIDLRSDGMAANFAVTGVDNGQPYKRIVNEDRVWVFVTPVSQDYLISIQTTAPTDYTLLVTIPPAATPVPTVTPPQRLSFAPGATSATATGVLPANGQAGYLLRAVVGQTMFVNLSSPGNIANFSVSGYNDNRVLKPLSDSSRNWSGKLPSTQDYLVTVVNPSAGSVNYTLVVSFSPLSGASTSPTNQVQRISFAPGAVSATVGGPIAGGSVQQYVLRAQAGQTMNVTVSSPTSDVALGVQGVRDGVIYQGYQQGYSDWSGVLPANQDYLLSVYAAEGNTSYSMVVTVTN